MLTLLAIIIISFLIAFLLKEARLDKKSIAILVLGILVHYVFLIIYNHFQNFIPFWDYAGYYVESIDGASLMGENSFAFLKSVYTSMLESDYTKLPILFTAPFIRIFGNSFDNYILINYSLFLVPFFVLMSILLYKINKSLIWMMFLFPPFLTPLLRGYLDSIGLLYVAVWLYVIYTDDFEELDIKRNVLLAILSLVLIFTRRWFLFFVFSAFAATAIGGFIRLLYENRKHKIRNLFLNLLMAGGIMLIILLVFFFPYMKRLFTNNLSEAYSAYQFGSLWWNIKYFMKYYGVITCFLSGIGAILGLFKKKTGNFTLFLILQSAIMFLAFTRVQSISYHHQYLFATNMLLFIIMGISTVKFKRTATVIVATYLVVYFLYSYVPTDTDFLDKYGFTAKRFAPKTMETSGILSLRDRLNALTEENGGHVYILASSETLNDEILMYSLLPETKNAVNNLLGTYHVDKRDGFPNNLLVAKYVVVADPVQVHLGVENQRIIEYFTNEILAGNASNLKKIYSIKIEEGVNAYIYERVAGYSIEFLDKAKKYFMAEYPDTEILHTVDYIYSQNP